MSKDLSRLKDEVCEGVFQLVLGEYLKAARINVEKKDDGFYEIPERN